MVKGKDFLALIQQNLALQEGLVRGTLTTLNGWSSNREGERGGDSGEERLTVNILNEETLHDPPPAPTKEWDKAILPPQHYFWLSFSLSLFYVSSLSLSLCFFLSFPLSFFFFSQAIVSLSLSFLGYTLFQAKLSLSF